MAYMKKLFSLFIGCMMIASFVSCERSSKNSEVSPIKGVWECQLNRAKMTLTFGDSDVEYYTYIEGLDASAIYQGKYTIQANNITLEFTSLKTKNSSGIEYYAPDKMPKEAVLKDENTIIYIDKQYIRK